MKIIFFNRYYFPDQSATSQILTDLATALAADGFEIHVVTSLSRAGDPPLEAVKGVHVHRVTRAPRRSSLALKGWDYVGYYLRARAVAKRLLSPGDIAVVKTDPPMLSAVIGPVARSNGARLVNWLQDVFPEIAIAYGVPGAKTPMLRRLRNRWLKRADLNVAIGDSMCARLSKEAGLSASHAIVIPNWARGDEISADDSLVEQLRKDWGIAGKFVVGYSGNLGRVHEFDTMLGAAVRLRTHHDITFLIIGSGPRLAEVRAAAEAAHLSNVIFRPPQDRNLIGRTLKLPDVHLCILRPEFESLVVPSKLYGILAAGRPAIYIGSEDSDVSRMLLAAGSGIAIGTGQTAALAESILALKSDPVACAAMGKRARQSFLERYDFPVATTRWRQALSGLRTKHSASAKPQP